MFRDSFYKVNSSVKEGLGSFTSTITIDKAHPIFKGHFPAVPVVPGVVMMQTVKELVEGELQKQLRLVEAGSVKFLSVVNPNDVQQLTVTIKYLLNDNNTYRVDAAITSGQVTYFKLAKAIFK